MSREVCSVKARLYVIGGPHDGVITPAVFSLTEVHEWRTVVHFHSGRHVRYDYAESRSGPDGSVILVYRFAGYVTGEEEWNGVW